MKLIGRTDTEAEGPILWPPDVRADLLEKTLMLGKIEGKRRREWQRMRWSDSISNSIDKNLDSEEEGEGGMIWENGIETCILSCKK